MSIRCEHRILTEALAGDVETRQAQVSAWAVLATLEENSALVPFMRGYQGGAVDRERHVRRKTKLGDTLGSKLELLHVCDTQGSKHDMAKNQACKGAGQGAPIRKRS